MYPHTHVGHECTFPGCASVIVIDGNLKNRRDICACTSAGLTFDGLPGKIKTGCQLTPAWHSKYCHDHAPRMHSKMAYESEQYCPDEVIQFITGKSKLGMELISITILVCIMYVRT